MNKFYNIIALYFCCISTTFAGIEIQSQTLTKLGLGGHATAAGLFIKTAENTQLPECGGDGFYILPHHANLQENLRLLTTAWQSNDKVSFYVEGCFNSKTIVHAVSIVKE